MVNFFQNLRKLFLPLILISLITLFFYLFKKNGIPNENQYQKKSCPKSPLAIAYFGQSNSANSVNKISKLNIPDNLYQYNWKDNKCYIYKEPLIGATDIKGNSITPFAISLANNIENNLLIIPYGIGNTNIESWSKGDNSLFHKNLLENLKSKKIKVELFLFHQGESDSFVVRNLSKIIEKSNYSKKYLFNLLKIIDQTRVYFPESYFGLSIVSKCYGPKPNNYIIDSQKEATKLRHNVFISADSDSVYGRKYRYDGCHFNLKGVEEISKMYSDSFMDNIFKY